MHKGFLDILLVEDNPDNQMVFTAYLKKSPHKVQVVREWAGCCGNFTEEKF